MPLSIDFVFEWTLNQKIKTPNSLKYSIAIKRNIFYTRNQEINKIIVD